MKKIERAALKHAPYNDIVDEQARVDFLTGARYVLDALVSEDSVRAIDRVRILRTSTADQLAAVRKEIEGE